MDEVLRYQVDRWRRAVADDHLGKLVVLDGDPFKLYFSWAVRQEGALSEGEWQQAIETVRTQFAAGDLGLADLVLYSDPGEDELRRRKASDATRSRRNFERNTALRSHFRHWYQALSALDPVRVIWEHPAGGLTDHHLALGPRPSRSDPKLLDRLLEGLPT